jgi:hypothetical protein
MAKVPLMPDNAMLRGLIQVMEDPDLKTPSAHFFRIQLSTQPEFNIWAEHDQLREAAKDALDADNHYRRMLNDLSWFDKARKSRYAQDVEKVRKVRDEKFDDYEFLRRLIANDNMSIALLKTK